MWISCEGEEFILFSFNRKFRTFELRSKALSLGKEKKNKLFFCFSLAYS